VDFIIQTESDRTPNAAYYPDYAQVSFFCFPLSPGQHFNV